MVGQGIGAYAGEGDLVGSQMSKFRAWVTPVGGASRDQICPSPEVDMLNGRGYSEVDLGVGWGA